MTVKRQTLIISKIQDGDRIWG